MLRYNKKIKAGKFIVIGICLAMAVFLAFASKNAGIFTENTFKKDVIFSALSADASDKIDFNNSFAEPVKNISCESPQMALISENSAVGVCSPNLVSPKVLGSIIDDSSEERTGITEYTVEQNDTLSSIAEKFNISQNTILWANDLSSKSAIKPGQELVILPVSGVLHPVKEGDTIEAVASLYKVKPEDIVAFNNLKNEQDVYIGDILIIPGGKITPKIPKVEQIPIADSYFIVPVEGRISQGSHGAFGAAIDIANACGTPVIAAAGGRVQRTGYDATGGNFITILHSNGAVTYYGHLSVINVFSGQNVASGEIIGSVGNTGYVRGLTGCHLHFETRGARNFLSRYSIGTAVSWKK